mmetsp:Transcript_14737/g.10632  ORF Transcript_14737/g.10632 Transcript_14737/m.10632 type:complete len:224 (+) Transcript_14737:102-773(+)
MDKVYERTRREELLREKPVDITPSRVSPSFPWAGKDLDQFEDEYSLRLVKVTGVFDTTKEVQVQKYKNGERGVEVITPFYTHLNENGEECGILVNRGWIPYDLKDLHDHKFSQTHGEITGVLYRGDNPTKYSQPNMPFRATFTRMDPYDFSLIYQMKNEDAQKFMLMQVDLDDEHRQILPSCPNRDELLKFTIPAERHEAYASMWKFLTYAGVLANTTFWLYF